MSGTSLDGVDGVLARWSRDAAERLPTTLAFAHVDFPPALRAELLALNTPGPDEIHRAAVAANALARAYADVVGSLLAGAGLQGRSVRAIGAHGQTVRHRPRPGADDGYTVQLLNGALLAERTGIDVICDFRSRDVAAGGHGAPLVPAFHAACFRTIEADRALLNVGGIANLTLLPALGPVTGFDTGPGNLLLDAWIQRRRGLPFDEGGQWAASGRPLQPLLRACRAEPFFAEAPPKSTGRDLFGPAWLDARLADAGLPVPDAGTAAQDLPPGFDADVAATLLELTAGSVADALLAQRARLQPQALFVCGGGAFNGALMQRLRALLPGVEVNSTLAAGVPPDRVEALAFAWLAKAFTEGRPGNLPEVTGATGTRVLGACYPAAVPGA